MKIQYVKTTTLHQAYEDSGPANGQPVLLVHGWPDSPRTWDKVLPLLHDAGYRTIVPYLRGYGASRFRDRLLGRNPRRTGQPVAFAQDLIDLADRLRLPRFQFIGHDWGARTGYALAALFPQRLKSLAAISVPFEPGKAAPPKFPQARAFWYQWLLCTQPGERKFREDPIAFGKAQWDAWSPPGWYTQAEFDEAAKSWKGQDFQDVVLHGYRSRWGHAELDPRYARLQTKFQSAKNPRRPHAPPARRGRRLRASRKPLTARTATSPPPTAASCSTASATSPSARTPPAPPPPSSTTSATSIRVDQHFLIRHVVEESCKAVILSEGWRAFCANRSRRTPRIYTPPLASTHSSRKP